MDMIRFNLRERIQVVRPFDQVNFGRFVAGREELTRRKLLVLSFNAISDRLRRQFDLIDALVSYESFIRALDLSNESLCSLIKTGRLREEDISLHLFKRKQPYEGLNELLRLLNSACAFRKIDGREMEFYMTDTPGYPGSVISLRPASGQAEAVFGDPQQVKNNFKEMLLPDFKGKGVFRRNHIYSESDIRDLYVKYFGPVTIQMIKDLILEETHQFYPIIRPRQFDYSEKLYTHSGTDYQKSGAVPVLVSRLRGFSAAALKRELPELRREGRLVIIYDQVKNSRQWRYIMPNALAEGLENGSIRRTDRGLYVAGDPRLKLPRFSEESPVYSAAKVFLNYRHERHLTPRAKGAYPFLAAAIEVLRSSPSGAEEYLEAAQLAAEYNVGEEYVNALLLMKECPYKGTRFDFEENWYLNNNKTYSFSDYLFELMRDRGLSMVDCKTQVDKIKLIQWQLQSLLAASIDHNPPRNTENVETYLRQFNSLLAKSRSAKPFQISYFALVIAKLRRTAVDGLSKETERQLRIITATMAERLGFQDLAAEIRDQLFRITNNQQYCRMRRMVERTYSLKFSELQTHVGKTTDLIREILEVVGINPGLYTIEDRVKLFYSAWEKMQSLKVKKVGLLKDLLGIKVIAADDKLAYRIMDLLQQAFGPVDGKGFSDQHGLVRYLKKIGYESYMDQIAEPRQSGFSALFYHCLTELGLPLELQVTSRERDKVNNLGKAAHWKHKIRREVKSTYGIEIGELADPGDQ